MRLIAYTRVSSLSQEDNTSLTQQRERINAYCQAFGHELVHVYTEVASASSTKGRPQFKEAIKALGDADGLIALKTDRIARNTRDMLTVVYDVLEPLKKELIIIDQQIDTTTSAGRMVLTILAAVDQEERERISARTKAGMEAKKLMPGHYAGSPPYGYRAVKDGLEAIPEQQAVIALIRKHRRSGKSMLKVARWLNAQGYTTQRGAQWTETAVKRVLDRLPAKSPA